MAFLPQVIQSTLPGHVLHINNRFAEITLIGNIVYFNNNFYAITLREGDSVLIIRHVKNEHIFY